LNDEDDNDDAKELTHTDTQPADATRANFPNFASHLERKQQSTRKQTALDRIDRVTVLTIILTLTSTCDLDFHSPASYHYD